MDSENTPKKHSQRSSPGDTQSLDLTVLGMTCSACVSRVEKAITAVPGVQSAGVNLVLHRAHVSFDGAKTKIDSILDAIRARGYEPILSIVQDQNSDSETEETLAQVEVLERLEDAKLARDLGIAFTLALPLVFVAMSHGAFANSRAGGFLQFALASCILFGPGLRFLRLAFKSLQARSGDMNLLIAMGSLSAWAYSTVSLFLHAFAPATNAHSLHMQSSSPHLYFEAAGAIVAFVLLGKWMENGARKRLSEAVRKLSTRAPRQASRLLEDGNEEEIAASALRVGDLFVVRPGETIATDGLVLSGSSHVDASMLSGESKGERKEVGSRVFGGTLNQNGVLHVRAEAVGRGTALAQIVRAVEDAQASKAPIARAADRVSAIFVPVVLGIAFLSLAVWWFINPSTEGFAFALERFVSVLVIACPCALGLATPAAIAMGTRRGADLGILVRGGEALEAASRVDLLFLDKTGTLTQGQTSLVRTVVLDSSLSEDEVLRLAASLESASEHPLARALVQSAQERGLALSNVGDFEAITASGVQGMVDGQTLRVGKEFFASKATSPEASSFAEIAGREGLSVVWLGNGETLLAGFAIGDLLRPETQRALEELKAMQIQISILSGDSYAAVSRIANELKIESFTSNISPTQKSEQIRLAQANGKIVAMVGDGINDAPALALANVGIAISSGSDIAVSTADIALFNSSALFDSASCSQGIERLPLAFALARRTMRVIRQNLFWASIYNLLGIPLAAGFFYGFHGLLLSPMVASAAMSLSSVSVLFNSLGLRRFRA